MMHFVTGADRIVLWVTLAYAHEYMIQHYAYAPLTKGDLRELSRYTRIIELRFGLQSSEQCFFFAIFFKWPISYASIKKYTGVRR